MNASPFPPRVNPRFALITWRHMASCIGIFLAAAIVARAASEVLFTPPEIPKFAQKIVLFDEVDESIDVLFVGASFIGSHISPRVFDDETGLHSFNFGLGNTRGHELEAKLHRLLDRKTPRLRYVVIDIADWPARLDRDASVFLQRDLPTAIRSLRWAVKQDDDNAVEQHIELFLIDLLRLGQALTLGERSSLHHAEPDGFVPYSENHRDVSAGRSRLLQDPAPFIPVQHLDNREVSIEGLLRIQEFCYETGVIPIFLRTPMALRFGDEQPGDYDVLDHVFWYDDPDRYPQFYARAARWDHLHLNATAAERFTRLFATDFMKRSPGLTRIDPIVSDPLDGSGPRKTALPGA